LRHDLVEVKSQNFTDSEACEFIKQNAIDVNVLDKNGIEANNNPRILRAFKNTAIQTTIIDSALLEHDHIMKSLFQDLFLILERKEYELNLSQSLIFLEYAHHGVPISKQSNLAEYEISYLDAENLTYATDESSETFTIKFHIPDVYRYIVEHLRKKYAADTSDNLIWAIPIVHLRLYFRT
jgi:hypothetical protein